MAGRRSKTARLPEDSWVMEGDDEESVSDFMPDATSENELQAPHDGGAKPASEEEEDDEPTPKPPLRATPRTTNGTSPRVRQGGLAQASPSRAPRNARRNHNQAAAEPELVMPSFYGSMGGSWAGVEDDGRRKTRQRTRTAPRSVKENAGREDTTVQPAGRKRHQGARNDGDSIKRVLLGFYHEMVKPVLEYMVSFLITVLSLAKPVFALMAAAWIIIFLTSRFWASAMNYALAPVCALPGVSYVIPSLCLSRPSGPVEFDELMTVQSAFEDVLESSAGGASLPVDMKRSEASIRDLKHVVRYSALPSRNELVFEFEGFIDTARQASGDLSRFNSRIGHAVDHVLTTNRWTLHVLDGVAEREAETGSLIRFFDNTILLPFRSPKLTESLLLDQYIRHARAVEEEIAVLIIEAQALLGILQNLDDRLDVIHSVTTRDGIVVKGERDELFANLWTWLGGNRGSVKKTDEQLTLLRQVAIYRKTAWDHVSGTVIKLQSIAAGLEDLRERVAAPEVLGYREDIPLRVHIENIQMGVERLEQQRTESRKIEGENYRRIVDKGGADEQRRALDAR